MTKKDLKLITDGICKIGRKCAKCGSPFRYVKDNRCVFCKRRNKKEYDKDPKNKQHKKEYDQRPENRQFDKERKLYEHHRINFERRDWIAAFQREFFNVQYDICPFCLQPLDLNITEQTKFRVSIDHDHNTGLIRGAVHDLCNRAIGLLESMNPDHPALKQYKEFVREFQFAYYEKFPDPCPEPIRQKVDKTVQLTDIELPSWNTDAWSEEDVPFWKIISS